MFLNEAHPTRPSESRMSDAEDTILIRNVVKIHQALCLAKKTY